MKSTIILFFICYNCLSASPEKIYEQIAPSVLYIRVKDCFGEQAYGTAFIAFKPFYAITAYHVIANYTNITATSYNKSIIKNIKVHMVSREFDLALLKLDTDIRFKPLSLSFKPPKIGEKIYTIGHPLGLKFSLIGGMFSQSYSDRGYMQYQLSCPFSEGNSGGPVINSKGKVVGVARAISVEGQCISFAVAGKYMLDIKPGF